MNTEQSIIDEVKNLKEKFDKIRGDTEEFIVDAKSLSDKGVNEAKELIDSAKKNWQGILSSFGATGISGLFSKAKAKKKKVVAKVKKAKTAVRKIAKKKKK